VKPRIAGRPRFAGLRDALGRTLLVLCTQKSELDEHFGVEARRERLFGFILWRESAWKNGALHGIEVWHALRGDARLRREWREGVLFGTWREWHGNGVKALECALENGLPHGQCTAWRRDGSKRFVGTYRAGAMTGEWYHLTSAGKLDRERTGLYVDGERLSGIKGFNEWLGSP
jgi:hypothetical protein